MSPVAESILDRLDAARQRWWLFTLLATAVLATCVSLAVFLALLLADVLWRFSPTMLAVLFVAWLAISLVLVLGLGRRLLRGQRSMEATARRVESEFPELGSHLINMVQFAGDAQPTGLAFREAAVAEAADAVGSFRFDRAAGQLGRWRRLCLRMQTPRDLAESSIVLGALVGVAVACHVMLPTWGSAARRFLTPWTFVPAVGSVEILDVAPGDVDVLVGTGLEIAATIRNARTTPYTATAWIASGDDAEVAHPMTADRGGAIYRFAVPTVKSPLTYRLEIGDSQTRVYHVGVRPRPTIAEVEVVYHFPRYLAQQNQTVRQRDADIEAPQYTLAGLRIRASAPVAKGRAESKGMSYPGRASENGRFLTIPKLPMLASGAYTIELENDAGHRDPNPRPNRMTVLPDRPPKVALASPGARSSAAPGETIAVVVSATDDHGLGGAQLEMRMEGAPPDEVETVHRWDNLKGPKEVVLRHELLLDPERCVPGRTVLVRAAATDQRSIDRSEWGVELRPQPTESPWHAIAILDRDERIEAEIRRLDDLRAAVYKILLEQIRARSDAVAVPRLQIPERSAALADDVRGRQVGIQKSTAALAESIQATDRPDHQTMKRVLGSLATGEMPKAVRSAERLARAKDAAGRTEPAAELGRAQEAIIAALRGLLDVVRRAETELLAAMKTRPGGDLPDDARKRLQAAKEKLEEFLRQQNKVIEATENLAKKPVEDFTEEEAELMRQLAAIEDDWAIFLKELHSDLSKLAEQDFSNSSMASEINEIQTEIKMAADALTKKTADIAVPLEQLGAEMAEELLTNMEKWLPDEPDRERWSQEESLTDLDKEAPMAELPGELEDLVGELFEEEEDLFDEMEDVSSSAADSLDVGAGWDAKDGPISNMSAKGVTGNTLPNTSEMSGRSGEGRSGKSSGEFVGDEAVGKGGRRTPSRLTPDPYEEGQVKDHSRDPVGGATGGGKESGQGGQGLEGPQSRSAGKRDLKRLAGKQADLRNKAEAIDLKFQIANYHHTDLAKMIDVMAQVERDLKAGRYQNALRQRGVLLEGLGQVKQYTQGQVELRKDTSVNLPADVQKDILGGMQDPSPPGWEELNRQYYERLSKGGASE